MKKVTNPVDRRVRAPKGMTLRQAVAHSKAQVAARDLARQGRGSDTEVVHVARGEIVVPQALQNPEVLAALRRAAAAYDVPLAMLSVGNAMNRINPKTGAPEFNVLSGAMLDWVSGQFKDRPESHVNLPDEHINDAFSPPSNGSLEYDPYGPSELATYVHHPIAAIPALWHGWRAKNEAMDQFGDGKRTPMDDEGDAWRHARWSQRMAGSRFVGSEIAKEITDAHERGPNVAGARSMDLYNNQIGRLLADDSDPEGALQRALKSGRLRIRPFEP